MNKIGRFPLMLPGWRSNRDSVTLIYGTFCKVTIHLIKLAFILSMKFDTGIKAISSQLYF